MSNKQKLFNEKSKEACNNIEAKSIISRNLSNYYKNLTLGIEQFRDLEKSKKRAYYYKYKTIENLDKFITDFETKFTNRGGNILFVNNIEQAQNYLRSIINNNNVKKIAKTKSKIYDELSIDELLKSENISVFKTELVEFLNKNNKEKSNFFNDTPIELSFNNIVEILNEQYNQTFTSRSSIDDIISFIRNLLREEFSKIDMCISSCNFLIPELGAISVSENDASFILSYANSPILVVIASIDDFIPSLSSLELFQSLYASHSVGQNLTALNHLIFSPSNNSHGPSQLYLFLVDNNRHKIIEKVDLREAAYCIKCDACSYHCPVYKQIGASSYGKVYSGPIGKIVSPFIFGEKDYQHLPFASTLCGNCNEVCPIQIDLTGLLLEKRKQIVDKKQNTSIERYIFRKLFMIFRRRRKIDRLPTKFKDFVLKNILSNNWGIKKEIPKFSAESYSKIRKQSNKSN